jgi:hypothetical protein
MLRDAVPDDRARRHGAGGGAVRRAHHRLHRRADVGRPRCVRATAAYVEPALGSLAAALFARACEQGARDRDDASLIEYLRGRG